MSEVQAASASEAVFDLLEPKIVANHVSKIDGMGGVAYGDILHMVGDTAEPLADRLAGVANFVGDASLTEVLVEEAKILRLCATGREDEVEDAARQAAYAASDANQAKDAVSDRNLDFYLKNGVEIIFGAEDRAAALRHCDLDTRDVPLIEKLKAQRLLKINGFEDSRVMYAVHDMIDHAWLFDQMREAGIMDRYADFLTSIEAEDGSFLYSRQAELLASVGFGARRWSVAKNQGESLIFMAEDLKGILNVREDDRTADAARRIDEMNPDEQQQAVFMIENMAVQLTDERRRWGAVKQVEGEQRKPMDLLDPVHVALMIETLSLLQRSRAYGGVQLQATIRVEEMLQSAMTDDDTSGKLYIPIPRGSVTESGLTITTDHEQWLRHNLSVSTSYNKIG